MSRGPTCRPRDWSALLQSLTRCAPDLVLIAGDLVSEKRAATHIYTAAQVVAPLGGLRAPLGVVVAPGNHDHWFDPAALRGELEARKIRVLQNEAVKLGPLVIGGIDDDYSGHADVAATLAAMMDRLGPGVPLILTHSPDTIPAVKRPVAAILAGHTHCGQIRFPFIGAISYVSRYGDRFACGDIRDGRPAYLRRRRLGTSLLPLRFNTPPDAWLVTLKAKAARP